MKYKFLNQKLKASIVSSTTDERILLYFASVSDLHYYILKNISLTTKVLFAIAENTYYYWTKKDIIKLSDNLDLPDSLRLYKLLLDKSNSKSFEDVKFREYLANKLKTPTEILKMLANDEKLSVRQLVSQNPSTHKSVDLR